MEEPLIIQTLKPKRELLNGELFFSLAAAQVIIETWAAPIQVLQEKNLHSNRDGLMARVAT